MRIIFLGTGTPRHLDRANACVAVQLTTSGTPADSAETVLLDSAGGNEVLRQLRAAAIAPRTVHHIVISHQHFDHAAGLAILLLELSRYPGGAITVYCPAAGLAAIRSVVEVQCPGVISTRLGDRLRFEPLETGQHVRLDLPDGIAELAATEAIHPVPALGCVLAWNGYRLGYSGDTSPTSSAAAAYAGVDVLIHEASGREGPGAVATHAIGHSTAADAGRVAAAAGVQRLVLTHFPPFPPDEMPSVVAEAAAHFGGPLQAAEDLLAIDLLATRRNGDGASAGVRYHLLN